MEGPHWSHREEQRRQGRNNSDIEEIQASAEEDEGTDGWTDYLIRDFTSVWNKEPRIHKFEEDGSQDRWDRVPTYKKSKQNAPRSVRNC